MTYARQPEPKIKPMTKPKEQRLEAWMGEVTSVLCYQPEVPQRHKEILVAALKAFEDEIDSSPSNAITTLIAIKSFALTTKLSSSNALAHIVRMCIDAGVKD